MYPKLLTICVLAAAFGLAACSQDNNSMAMNHHDHSAMETNDTAYKAALASGAVDVGNTKCVVTGDDVGASKLIGVYQGKIYHFCCSDCPAEFQKDPAKYAALVAADPAKYGVKK
jgi:YHS domain-containing protein